MEEVKKYLEKIKEHQMQTVQLARSTKVYQLADKALKAIDVIHCCKSDSEQLPKRKRECTCSGMSDKVKCDFKCYD